MKKNYFSSVSLFCIILLLSSIILSGCKSKKEILFASEYITIGNDVEPLIPLDSNAETCLIKDKGIACYKFTKNQKLDIVNVFNKKGSATISARVKIKPTEKQQVRLYNEKNFPFYFGFLKTQDFDSKGNLVNSNSLLNSKITVFAEESKFITDFENPQCVFEVNMAVPVDEKGQPVIPEGIFVYSDLYCELIHFDVDEAAIGFDYSNTFPVFGFSSNGGIVDHSCSHVDFSGGSLIFSLKNNQIPEIEITLSDNPQYKSTDDMYFFIDLQIDGEKFQINNVPSANKLYIPVSILKNKFPQIEITSNSRCVSGMKLKNNTDTEKIYNDVLTPLKADPGFILKYNMADWRNRDYEVFQWDRFPEILIFEFKDFEIQDKFLKRMAFFVEKTGYKGTLVTNEEFKNIHGFNANDYKASDFANFYNLADETGFELNDEEIILKKYLINNGILNLTGNGSVVAGKGGIASSSRQSGAKTESRLFVHEVLHTLFFIDEGFRNYVAAAYEIFDPYTKQFLIDYFDANPQWNYDTNDSYLMLNEFMSYIMEHKSSDVGAFFMDRATYQNVVNYTPTLCQYIIDTKGSGFTEAALTMEAYTYDKFGIKAGDVGLIHKF